MTEPNRIINQEQNHFYDQFNCPLDWGDQQDWGVGYCENSFAPGSGFGHPSVGGFHTGSGYGYDVQIRLQEFVRKAQGT